MKTFLSNKLYSLGAEIRHIRNLEKWKRKAARAIERRHGQGTPEAANNVAIADALQRHAKPLSREARAAGLAMAFMRNRPYCLVEPISYWPALAPNFDKEFGKLAEAIERNVEKFTPPHLDRRDVMQRFSEWIDRARAYAFNSGDCSRDRDRFEPGPQFKAHAACRDRDKARREADDYVSRQHEWQAWRERAGKPSPHGA